MSKPNEVGHLSEVPLVGHTKEWFKKDVKTIKNSFKSTIFKLHWILLVTLCMVFVFDYLSTFKIDVLEIFLYAAVFFPILTLCYFLLHIFKTKGYDIRTPAP